MYNYARNYRNWAPQRSPRASYQQLSYFPVKNSQDDEEDIAGSIYQEGDDLSSESRPFEDEVRAIDYYARRNRNHVTHDGSQSKIWKQGIQHDDGSRNSYQPDNPTSWNHRQGYSTLPDEFINTHSSSGSHDFRSTAEQDFQAFNSQNPRDNQEFRFKNQNLQDGQEFRLKNQSPVDSKDLRFKNHIFANGQEFRYKNQNFGGDQEFRFENHNSGKGQEPRLNVQNYRVVQETQSNSHEYGSEPTSAVRQISRHNTYNFGGRHELQHNTHIQNSDQESRLKDQHFRGTQNLRYNTQNSPGRYYVQNSGSGGYDSDKSFPTSNGNSNMNRPHRGTEQSQDGAGTSRPNPNSDDLYYKAFRSFSFRRNPTQSGSKVGQSHSFSGGGFNAGVVPQSSPPTYQNGAGHTDRQNKWSNGDTGPSKDHDIGFLEGLEDINDRAGV
jgi:hypothetical protein